MNYIKEPEREIENILSVDVCIVGGSCTGVFAAVRAARLGASVAIIEKQNCLGGTATCGLVNIWHSLYDTDGKNQIIAGLTAEVIDRLKKADGIKEDTVHGKQQFRLNSEELKIELDKLVVENKINLFLHTFYSGVIAGGKKINAVVIQNKDGRRAISARFFIDASGDGILSRDIKLTSYKFANIQPPTSCFLMYGNLWNANVSKILREHGHEENLENDWGWCCHSVMHDHISLRADNHIAGSSLDSATDLTNAEIEGRRQMRAVVRLLNKYGENNERFSIVSACSLIGIRDGNHYVTRFKADEKSLLLGKEYDSAVLNGTYRIDIHHSDGSGITFKDLNGNITIRRGRDQRTERGNWRKDEGYTGEPAKYYQVPFDILVNDSYDNFIPVGRMLNADLGSYGALRVMVNLNQLGEAAGTAAYLALDEDKPVAQLSGVRVRELLKTGGSAQ